MGNCLVNIYFFGANCEYLDIDEPLIRSNVTMIDLKIFKISDKFFKIISVPNIEVCERLKASNQKLNIGGI